MLLFICTDYHSIFESVIVEIWLPTCYPDWGRLQDSAPSNSRRIMRKFLVLGGYTTGSEKESLERVFLHQETAERARSISKQE